MKEGSSSFFRTRKLWFFVVTVVIVGSIFFFILRKEPVPEFSSAMVENVALVQSVNETGSVVADLEIVYGWEMSGRVVSIVKEVGDTVAEGDIIATLDVARERARYNEALASLASARAKLAVRLVGPSHEEKEQSSAAVVQAQAAVDQAYADKEKTVVNGEKSIHDAEKALQTAENNLQLAEGGEQSDIVNDAYADLVNTLKSVFTAASDGIAEADAVLGVDNTLANQDFIDYLSILDQGLLTTAKTQYTTAKIAKQIAGNAIIVLRSSDAHSMVDAAERLAVTMIYDTQSLLFAVQDVLNATLPLGSLSQSELDALKSRIRAAQVSVDTEGNSVTNGRQAIATARNSLSSYTIAYNKAVLDVENIKKQVAADLSIADAKVRSLEAQLLQAKAADAVLVAPPRSVDVASLQADVSRQAANVEALASDVQKGSLVALSAGVISVLDVEIGENVSANEQVIAIISPGLTIEVDVSESDIAKVALHDPVEVTLDAFGDDVIFSGSVLSIEPAETEVSGVIYYKIHIGFDDVPEGVDVRPGMTANVTVTTDTVEDALVLPQRAILEKNGQKVVRLLTDPAHGIYEEVPVTLGIRGDNGVVQIVSGLSEGQEVITFIKEE